MFHVVTRLTQSDTFKNGAPGARVITETSPRERSQRPPPTSSFVVDAQVTFNTMNAAQCFLVDIFCRLEVHCPIFPPTKGWGATYLKSAVNGSRLKNGASMDLRLVVVGLFLRTVLGIGRASVQNKKGPG